MLRIVCSVALFIQVCTGSDLPAIQHLSAEPDFREVTLRWEYARQVPDLHGFRIYFCELQNWGPNRCRFKRVDDTSGHEVIIGDSKMHMYKETIPLLRMATNYSFEVRPIDKNDDSVKSKMLGKNIVATTKGFSAKATQCLPHASEVEVLTGPYFAGRIAVEDAESDPVCVIDGDSHSSRDTYILRIDHKRCGSQLNETTVATFVVVQENLPILTHSTRRFLVLCTFQPDTLTVRAGINLPTQTTENTNNQVDHIQSEAISYDSNRLEYVNDVQVARLQHHRQEIEDQTLDATPDHSATHMLFMIVFLVAGLIGCIISAWWFIPSLQRRITVHSGMSDDSSSTSSYENFENSLRDRHISLDTPCDSSSTDSLVDADTSSIFTIRTPEPSPAARTCVTLELASHSEA